ncbi:MAG: AAA family ATPase [Bacteroidota bacterium]|nr:AAA family ATPase [Bacteroidota bacterium]
MNKNTGPLPIRYRPSTLDNFFGNEGLKKTLQGILERPLDQMPHSILLHGPSGTGKTTLARIIRKEMGCSDYDYHELNAADLRKIDDMRAVISEAPLAPLKGKIKIYYWDEAHQLISYSKEIILKILEEPPSHVFFLLATTEPERIPKTIQRRCTKLQTRLLSPPVAADHLKSVIKREKITGISPEVLKIIIKTSEGSASEALTLLDTVKDSPTKEGIDYLITLTKDTQALCRELLATIQGRADWADVKKIVTALDCDPEQARQHILNYLSKVLLSTGDKKIYEAMTYFTESFYTAGRAGLIMACFAACN